MITIIPQFESTYHSRVKFGMGRKIGCETIEEFMNSFNQLLSQNYSADLEISAVCEEYKSDDPKVKDTYIVSLHGQDVSFEELSEIFEKEFLNVKRLVVIKKRTVRACRKYTYDFSFSEPTEVDCETTDCKTCMKGAPYDYCCRKECREHEFCKECKFYNRLIGKRLILGEIMEFHPTDNDTIYIWEVPIDKLTAQEQNILIEILKLFKGKDINIIVIPKIEGNTIRRTNLKILRKTMEDIIKKIDKIIVESSDD